MALPALDSIAACWPGATVDVFCGQHSTAIFQQHPAIARILTIRDIPTWRDVLPLVLHFGRGSYDRLILLDRSRYLHTAARLAGARNIARPATTDGALLHESDVYLQVVQSAGCRPGSTIPAITPPPAARERAEAIAREIGGPFIAVQPGGAENPGTRMVSKRWPAENFAEVLRWASERGYATVLTGGPADMALCEQIVSAARVENAFTIAGTASLMDSAAVVERARVYVGVDTGMSHIAAAVGTPTVAIFGPTNPLRYGPRGERVMILAPPESEQIPDADLRSQGDAHNLPSTSLISVDDVLRACDELIGQPEKAAQ